MGKLVFSGCSLTAGNGWSNTDNSGMIECKDHPDLWVNLCHKNILSLTDLELVNVAVGGSSNSEIFKNTVAAIAEHADDIDILFCQWSSLLRYKFSVGFELWTTAEGLLPWQRGRTDVNLNRGDRYSRKYIDDLLDRFLLLHHVHYEIVKVVEYCNTLNQLADRFDITLYFLNGLCPWDQDYFVRLHDAMPEDYTPFTKTEILNIESRNDNDIFKLYNKMHDDYDQAGGIDPSQWINLYDSMLSNLVDFNYDNQHPGKHSNQFYFNQLNNFLNNQKQI
jgi:hypothetical protein